MQPPPSAYPKGSPGIRLILGPGARKITDCRIPGELFGYAEGGGCMTYAPYSYQTRVTTRYTQYVVVLSVFHPLITAD